MDRLSPTVTNLLLTHGWYPGRELDIEPTIQLFENRGIHVSNAAASFLREFDGLTIRTTGGLFELGTKDTLLYLDDRDIPYLSTITGESLCPVGQGLFLWLLLNAEGQFILLDDHWRGYIPCYSVNDAFEQLFIRETPKRKFIELGPECWPPGYQPIDG